MNKFSKNSKLEAVDNNIQVNRASWHFGQPVADNFVSHIARSVPLYELGHDLICKLSDFFVQDNSLCYELGTSTAQLLTKLAKFHSHKSNTSWIGIDSEAEMIKVAKKHCKHFNNIHLQHEDIINYEFKSCDLIIAHYCLQFIQPRFRQDIFNRIYKSLNWGGAFVLFEKVRAPDARFQDITTALHDDFKIDQGLSDQEIMSKKRSLRGILEPYSSQAQIDYLKRAGFSDIMTIMKYVNFEGLLAIK